MRCWVWGFLTVRGDGWGPSRGVLCEACTYRYDGAALKGVYEANGTGDV